MNEYKPYSIVKYATNGSIDKEWEIAIEREICMAQLRGDLRFAQNNPIARIALRNALADL